MRKLKDPISALSRLLGVLLAIAGTIILLASATQARDRFALAVFAITY